MMLKTSAPEFQRRFDEFRNQARREPLEISRLGQRDLILMSAEHYDWLKASAQRSHKTGDASASIIDAVERAEMDPAHKGLDDLLI
ncbi:type II toxin-antitoxin system prevent-host-death family antitoxin [Beijerinckia sp. L45]|uniref:type II toxin-antitoxin system prevent-host-death family antitoxin n=1 Tax=Beijerinckia sp. L45 TaxID=1641855 RepID=UPI001FED2FD2|nr:type II toxin-antitoxin system prevent-host-death family antitoxin [Beijerinckia sp. L45]